MTKLLTFMHRLATFLISVEKHITLAWNFLRGNSKTYLYYGAERGSDGGIYRVIVEKRNERFYSMSCITHEVSFLLLSMEIYISDAVHGMNKEHWTIDIYYKSRTNAERLTDEGHNLVQLSDFDPISRNSCLCRKALMRVDGEWTNREIGLGRRIAYKMGLKELENRGIN